MITESILTCPNCKYKESEEMHENVFPTKFNCGSCQQTVSIKDGECCIYCQFGDFPCLHTQIVGSACCAN